MLITHKDRQLKGFMLLIGLVGAIYIASLPYIGEHSASDTLYIRRDSRNLTLVQERHNGGKSYVDYYPNVLITHVCNGIAKSEYDLLSRLTEIFILSMLIIVMVLTSIYLNKTTRDQLAQKLEGAIKSSLFVLSIVQIVLFILISYLNNQVPLVPLIAIFVFAILSKMFTDIIVVEPTRTIVPQ